jgi:phosphate starvation-inducible protein PhoH and related proteins
MPRAKTTKVKQVQQAEPHEPPKRIRFWNDAQRQCVETILQNDITFVIGPAGASKTFCALAAASQLLKQGCEKVIFTRPIVPSAGEDLGWLGGSIAERTQPWMEPLYENAKKTGVKHEEIDIKPIAYLRGCTFSDVFAILDEGQNVTLSQMRLYLSRLGRGSKMVICGDADQCDIRESCWEKVIYQLHNLPGVGVFEFDKTHIVRHSLVAKILDALSA